MKLFKEYIHDNVCDQFGKRILKQTTDLCQRQVDTRLWMIIWINVRNQIFFPIKKTL